MLFFVFYSVFSFAQKTENSFEQRADTLIRHVADFYPRFNQGKRPPGASGDLSDFGKYNYPKIIALFSRYGAKSEQATVANQRLEIYKTKPTFHFNLVGLPRILYSFPQAPGIKGNEKEFIRRVWERDDSFNPWTAEGTENHVNMSRTPGYLYAQYALENFPQDFPDAKQKLEQMKQWIGYYSKRIFYTGTGEFNSSIYGAYNIIGWINLYDFAHDPQVKNMAKAVLDYYACELALHYCQTMNGGSDMRGKGQVEAFSGSTAYLSWLWFGDSPKPINAQNLDNGRSNNEVIQSIHAATSTYRVPQIALKLARKQLQIPAMYYNSKPSYMLAKPSYIKQTFFVDKNFNLGAGYFPYGGWSAGDWQIVSWKLISRVEPGKNKSPEYMSGIGMQSAASKYYKYGHHRSPFDQLVHHRNVLIQMTKVPENAGEIKAQIKKIFEDWKKKWFADFQKRFPNDPYKTNHNPVNFQNLDTKENASYLVARSGNWETQFVDNVLFVEFEKTFVAIRSLQGEKPAEFLPSAGKDMKYCKVSAEKGKICGFVIEVANKNDFRNFKKFQKKILKKSRLDNSRIAENQITYTALNGDKIQARYNDSGRFTEPMYDWGYGVQTPQSIQKAPPFRQPEWPQGKGHGKLAHWSVNGKKVDLDKQWAVYQGANLYIGDGKLCLRDQDGKCYSIDYSEQNPVFSEKCIEKTQGSLEKYFPYMRLFSRPPKHYFAHQ